MSTPRRPGCDPRTLARDIPGLLDALFPHLVPAVVAFLNRRSEVLPNCHRVSLEEVQQTSLSRAMLFELALAVAEQLLPGGVGLDWQAALELAVGRQRRHFDAREPVALGADDKGVALRVAENLVQMLESTRNQLGGEPLVVGPSIPGYRWVASGVGDFAAGGSLIEVKCTRRNFSAADYRQVMMYWLLSYISALEGRTPEWTQVVLMNARRRTTLTLPVSELLGLLAGGASKVELVELFSSIIDERRVHKLA